MIQDSRGGATVWTVHFLPTETKKAGEAKLVTRSNEWEYFADYGA